MAVTPRATDSITRSGVTIDHDFEALRARVIAAA
jgi:hypothetical protein